MADDPTPEEIELAERLYAEWDQGRGTSKSRIEQREWGDASAHGRRFDRFIRRTLGFPTTRPSRQTDRIGDLEKQLRQLGHAPAGTEAADWEPQLQHARSAALAALRVWNDPTATFRTGTFALLFVTAWNSLCIAMLQQRNAEWRKVGDKGNATLFEGVEQALSTPELIGDAFPGGGFRGLRENVQDWIELRNSVAHRHLPALDAAVIPLAQAGLLNFETAVAENFPEEYTLANQLSVPLQLSGFRDSGVLTSLKRLQASLPLDVQAVLSRVAEASPELLGDDTYMLRVSFIPAVPSSGRNPDAVAYFLRPGEVPEEVEEALQKYQVLPKVGRVKRPNLAAMQVCVQVEERISFRFNANQHAVAARALKVRPPKDGDQEATDLRYCEYVGAVKRHLYNEAWVNRLVEELSTAEGFKRVVGVDPTPKESD
ncbi:MAG TPA: DUF3644 domain-containing protein [Fimbriimonadaceae bacterium]|jgi:hypothetical protein|nr:DUF3644 domain-containing protein [Fimbriimonadaceae bacterium]